MSEPRGDWLRRTESTAAVIFVHGILSTEDQCWRSNTSYWPDLLANEPSLSAVGIYVFSYRTDIFSGSYSIGDAVEALNAYLKLDGLLTLKTLIFVCHSMGGIVVRQFIVTRQSALIEGSIRIGMFLIASPSLGSDYAKMFGTLAKALGHSQAQALHFSDNNIWLNDLDRNFMNLKESGRLVVKGQELVEDNFVLLPSFFRKQVVRPFSGSRYFGDSVKIPRSDHFNIAKPSDAGALQHRLLVQFADRLTNEKQTSEDGSQSSSTASSQDDGRPRGRDTASPSHAGKSFAESAIDPSPAPDDAGIVPTRSEEVAYLTRLIQEIKTRARLYSPLAGIANFRSGPAVIALDETPWSDDPDIQLLVRYSSHQGAKNEALREPRDYDDILVAFSEVKRVALLGDPGSGKSTALRQLALDLAQRALVDAQAPLPLLVSLGDWTSDHSLLQFLVQKLPEVGRALEALAQSRRLVLILDGLNKIPSAKRSTKAADVKGLISLLTRVSPTIGIVVSCRFSDYVGELQLGLDTLTLEPLSPPRIRAALQRFALSCGESIESVEGLFWQLAGDVRLRDVFQAWVAAGAAEHSFWSLELTDEEANLQPRLTIEWQQFRLEHLRDPRNLLKLASNPFMLTMLFNVWRMEGDLPINRGDLLEGFTICLMSRERLLVRRDDPGRPELTPDGKFLEDGLFHLSWRMQHDLVATDNDTDFGVLTVVPRQVAVDILGSEALLKKAQDTTLLQGSDEISFRHQLLQEYFTAKALQSRLDSVGAAELWPSDRWWERSGWEEIAILLAGLYRNDCSLVVRWLAEAQPEMAAACIIYSGAPLAGQATLQEQLQSAWMARLNGSRLEPIPEARAAIGRALGLLNLDNRRGIGLTQKGNPDIDWVKVPSGSLFHQGRERVIESFEMARYPITNIQFQAFLDDAGGYSDERWWKGLTVKVPSPFKPYWGESNHPRETVSWYEAMAFSSWLAHKLDLDVRLPTRLQWMKAAQGGKGDTYPWGTEFRSGSANIDEISDGFGPHRLGRTSPVGIYPSGASPEGICDLSGNVAEWCHSWYEGTGKFKPAVAKNHVACGGSFASSHDAATGASCAYFPPNTRAPEFGFRVVSFPP